MKKSKIIIWAIYGVFVLLYFVANTLKMVDYNIGFLNVFIINRRFTTILLLILTIMDKDKKLIIAFIFSVLGDNLFWLGLPIIGIFSFVITQVVLIIRHNEGFFKYVAKTKFSKILIHLSVLILILIFATISLYLVFYPALGNTFMFYVATFYAYLLSLSLWSGYNSCFLNVFSKKKSALIIIGMILFFISDYFVGISICKISYLDWTNNFVWVLYIPALLLLKLSQKD